MQRNLKQAEAQRHKFLQFFRKHGVKMVSNDPSKLYTGELSPGCTSCTQGKWACLYINGLCTRHCFYCPQDRTPTEERQPMPQDEPMEFRSPAEYVRYLKTFDFTGIGISGGEPFMVFDKLTEYIRAIRRAFGRKKYIWVYTNGDLVTGERLKLLGKLRLNEIRFDISANHYDLTMVKTAVKYIPTITIEIPAIPEDLAIIKGKLRQIENAGVKHLNIHQLMTTGHNRQAFKRRGYTLLKGPFINKHIPVLESELAGYEILKAAIKMNLKTHVNYCSTWYKARFQATAFSNRYAPFCKDEGEVVTEAGYVRRLSFDKAARHLIFTEQLEGMPDMAAYKPVFVTYYSIKVRPSSGTNRRAAGILTFGSSKLAVIRTKYSSYRLANRTSALLFQKLFVEKCGVDETVANILALFGFAQTERAEILDDVRKFERKFKDRELVSRELVEYFSL